MRQTFRTAVAAAALAASSTGFTQQLEARDINLDGITDAYYDSVQDLTWLADATYAATTLGVINDLRPPGAMDVGQSNAWAASLDVYGVTGWRLPVSFVPDLAALCDGVNAGACIGRITFESELSRLFDQVGTSSPFLNSSNWFWTGNTYRGPYADRDFVQYFNFGTGYRGVTDETGVPVLQAWAVHDGYVSSVPEPSSYALTLAGLGAVGIARRRRPRACPSPAPFRRTC